jgi:hypothetical protein
MNCLDVQEKIIDLVLGELSPYDEIQLREHLEECPMCRQEFQLISECIKTCSLERTETCTCHFQETYWEGFVADMHERLEHEKPEKAFPFHIVLPIAASALFALALGYYVFFGSKPEQSGQEPEAPGYYEYDPYEEIYELSPEEQERFIEIINQRYGP